jgi:hypothetical protein
MDSSSWIEFGRKLRRSLGRTEENYKSLQSEQPKSSWSRKYKYRESYHCTNMPVHVEAMSRRRTECEHRHYPLLYLSTKWSRLPSLILKEESDLLDKKYPNSLTAKRISVIQSVGHHFICRVARTRVTEVVGMSVCCMFAYSSKRDPPACPELGMLTSWI